MKCCSYAVYEAELLPVPVEQPDQFYAHSSSRAFEQFSHDVISRYLSGEKLAPRLLWENVKPLLAPTAAEYLIFDDTLLDKRFSSAIELVRR